VSRERRPNGNDKCEAEHTYPSTLALADPTAISESNRAESLAHANPEQQGENDALRVANTVLLKERDLYREAWAKAQAHLDCGSDAADALRDERAAVVAWLRDVADDPETFVEEATLLRSTSNAIERGEHRREENE
jgi:hypothetical protein